MKFLGLEIQNFLSIEHTQTHLNDRGLILVQGDNTDSSAFGSNGAGKSSIFSESIVWALFGETIRGYKGDDVINRDKKKDAFVHLQLQDDNGDTYTIERYRKHKEYKNSVRLLKNGDNITGKSDTETTRMIEDLLQIDFLAFTNSVLFGQGMSKKFANSTDAEQKKILEKILQIDIFKKCQDIAKKRLETLNLNLSEASHEIQINQNKLDSQKANLKDLQEKEAQLGEATRKRIKDLESQIDKYNLELLELPDTEGLEEEKNNFKNLKLEVLKQLRVYDSIFDQKVDIGAKLRSSTKELDKLNDEIDTSIKKLDQINKGLNIPKICSACGQEIPKGDMSHIIKHLQEDIVKKDSQALVLEDEIKVLEERLKNVEGELEGKKKLDEQKEQLDEVIHDIDKQISSTENKKNSVGRLIKNVEEQIKREKKSLEKTYSDLIEKAINLIAWLEEEGKRLVKKKEDIQTDADLNSFWVDGFGNKGIKSKLLDDVVPFLNTRANHYLGRLSDNSMEVQFNTQYELKSGEKRDRFSVGVNNLNGGDKYQGNSGGECRRIDVAVNMALQDLVHSRSNKKVDLIVYDECFEALDRAGCEVVIELLKEKAKTCGSVFVITHNSDLAEMFSSTLMVTKKNGKTIISEG